MRHFATVFCALLLSSAAHAGGVKDAVRAAVLKTIQDEQPVENSGVSVAVFTSKETILAEGFGWRDRAHQEPATASTLYAIGSTTKAFTAMSVMKLVENDAIKLDDLEKDALPGFRLESDERTNQVQVVDLLSHATGLPRHDALWYLTPFSRDDLITRLPYLELNKKPGYGYREAFQYNNLMFLALGQTITAKTGLQWETFVTSHVLAPLDMRETYFDWDSAEGFGDLAKPYNGDKELPYFDASRICPAGCMVSNVTDLAKWVQLHLRQGKLADGRPLVQPSTIQELFMPRIGITPERPSLKYGLAWMIQEGDADFPTAIFHGGNIDGFTAMVFLAPELDLGVVALSNQNGTRVPNDIAVAVTEAVLKARQGGEERESLGVKPDLSVATRFEQPVLAAAPAPRPASAAEVGRYEHPGYGVTSILEQDGKLWFDYYGHTWPMAQTDGAWSVQAEIAGDAAPIPVQFLKTDSGEVTTLTVPWEPEVADIPFKK